MVEIALTSGSNDRARNNHSIHHNHCHHRRRREGAESYEELESRGQRIRQILDSTDSFHSDTPTNAVHGGDGGGGWRGGGGGGGQFSSTVSQEGRVMVAFTLKEVRIHLFTWAAICLLKRIHSRREEGWIEVGGGDYPVLTSESTFL